MVDWVFTEVVGAIFVEGMVGADGVELVEDMEVV